MNLKVSDAIIKSLEKENIDTVFGYPGGAVLPLYESLRTSNIKHILVRHEQSAAHSANSYGRAIEKTGVCMVTSGPGATNLITGIATAYMDSIPLVIITGQVKSTALGKDVFQEADITGATEPFTKHNFLVKDPESIPRIFKEAFYIASTGRPGPVLIDIPVDIQNMEIKFDYPNQVDIIGYKPTIEGHMGQIKRAITKLKSSKKPLICVGGGVICSRASDELRTFVERSKIPIIHTLMGLGSFPTNSPYYVGMVGSHGHDYSNIIVTEADLIMIVGARVGDRFTSGFEFSNKKVDIIHVDIDPAEIGKNLDITIPIVGDAKTILRDFSNKISQLNIEKWMDRISVIKKNHVKNDDFNNNFIDARKAIKYVSDIVDENTILTADVGQNQFWAAHSFEIKGDRKFFTSGGLGTMGYSLPAAIGAKLASPEKKVICVVGDGGIQMSLSELGTLSENNLDIIIILFNNNKLGMVKELQDFHYGKSKNFGSEYKLNPDFVKIAEAYGLNGKAVSTNNEFEETFKIALEGNKGFLIECKVDPDYSTL